jgi:hypothetical protein
MDCLRMTPIAISLSSTSSGRGNDRTRAFAPLLLLFFSTLAAQPAIAAGKLACGAGQGSATKEAAGFQIKVLPSPRKVDHFDPECRALILDARNNEIFSADDWGFSIEVAGQDATGDGIPDVVLKAYSGGAHCCWTYYVISLGSKPGLVKKFENNRDAVFFRDKESGRIVMSTLDGAFDYFDGLCHACTPFPDVYLRLDGTNLIDISPEFVTHYDEIIAENRKTLTAEERHRLRVLTEKPSDAEPAQGAVHRALMIVLAYLYSGREAQARQALQELWPPFDQERIWNLILETRHNGILCYTRNGGVCGPDAADQ